MAVIGVARLRALRRRRHRVRRLRTRRAARRAALRGRRRARCGRRSADDARHGPLAGEVSLVPQPVCLAAHQPLEQEWPVAIQPVQGAEGFVGVTVPTRWVGRVMWKVWRREVLWLYTLETNSPAEVE
eukprot:scaffold113657_cov36-Phaeocystis_antarctica.AAC.1